MYKEINYLNQPMSIEEMKQEAEDCYNRGDSDTALFILKLIEESLSES